MNKNDFTTSRRQIPETATTMAGIHPVLARLYAARGAAAADVAYDLRNLLSPVELKGIDSTVDLLATAIVEKKTIIGCGDFDSDGCLALCLVVSALRAMGAARVEYLIPNRITHGYGLSPVLAEMAKDLGGHLVLTVDNGIAAHNGIERARSLGMQAIVTDHHGCPNVLPDANAIVNPHQPGCTFGSKALAGVGVAFYVMCALRQKLKPNSWFTGQNMPTMASFLDLVAVATIGDMVPLDYNNRVLVEAGLRRIRNGLARPGIQALLQVAKIDATRVTSADIAFSIVPRINAAGRLRDMTIGVKCLLAETLPEALGYAQELDLINKERREMQGEMQVDAMKLVESNQDVGICVASDDFHEGLIGLVASRIKEEKHRPTFAFTKTEDGHLKGSGRSINGFHLRDALVDIETAHPGLQIAFGGHQGACGTKIPGDKFEEFRRAFDAVCRAKLTEAQLSRVIETDGPLSPAEFSLETAKAIEMGGPWGQAFPEPIFEGSFAVIEAKAVGQDSTHARYRVRAPSGATITAIHFGGAEDMRAVGAQFDALFRTSVNRWNGKESLDAQIVTML